MEYIYTSLLNDDWPSNCRSPSGFAGVPQVTRIVASSSMSPDASMAGCNGCLDGEPWRFDCGPNGISRQRIAFVVTGAEVGYKCY